MYYVRIKSDTANRRWKVREAISVREAYNAIIMAMVSGSVGSKHTHTETVTEDGHQLHISDWKTVVAADVVEVNSDLTECKPYHSRY